MSECKCEHCLSLAQLAKDRERLLNHACSWQARAIKLFNKEAIWIMASWVTSGRYVVVTPRMYRDDLETVRKLAPDVRYYEEDSVFIRSEYGLPEGNFFLLRHGWEMYDLLYAIRALEASKAMSRL